MQNRYNIYDIFIHIALFIFVLVCVYPFYFVIIGSFSNGNLFNGGGVWILPKGFTLSNYKVILSDTLIWYAFRNTIIKTLFGTTVSLLFTSLVAQIETIDGLNNIHEILSVDGLDGFFLGPNDLSADFNCLDNDNAGQILEAIDQLKIVSSNLNKTAGIITTNPNYLKRAKINQYQMISVGSELSMLKKASKDIYNLIMEN